MSGLIDRISEFRSNLRPKICDKWSWIWIEKSREGLLLSSASGSLMFIEVRPPKLAYAHFRFGQKCILFLSTNDLVFQPKFLPWNKIVFLIRCLPHSDPRWLFSCRPDISWGCVGLDWRTPLDRVCKSRASTSLGFEELLIQWPPVCSRSPFEIKPMRFASERGFGHLQLPSVDHLSDNVGASPEQWKREYWVFRK